MKSFHSAGLFALFSIGMSASSLQFTILNTTSVENLGRKSKIWTLAVYIESPRSDIANTGHTPYQTITYPLSSPPNSAVPRRSFAILHTKPGDCPFDLGPWGNFREVMGYSIWEWLLPVKMSPCCDHRSGESAFKLGPVVQRMREEAGLPVPESVSSGKRKRRRHRNSRQDYGAEQSYSQTRRSRQRGVNSSGPDQPQNQDLEMGDRVGEGGLAMGRVIQRPADTVVR